MPNDTLQRACIHSLHHWCIDHEDGQDPVHYCCIDQIIYIVDHIDEYIDDVILHLIRLSNKRRLCVSVRQCQCERYPRSHINHSIGG